jgi:hypothetical protein
MDKTDLIYSTRIPSIQKNLSVKILICLNVFSAANFLVPTLQIFLTQGNNCSVLTSLLHCKPVEFVLIFAHFPPVNLK